MRWRRGTVFVAAILCAAPAAARAHAQYRPFSLNRYTVVAFERPGIVLYHDVLAGDVPAQELRQRADQNEDGRIDESEMQPLRAWMRARVEQGLALRLDGARVRARVAGAEVRMPNRQLEQFSPVLFRLRLELSCPPGLHELVLHDRTRLPALEQSELFIRTRPGLTLLRVARTAQDRGAHRRMFWEGGRLPGPVAIRFELAGDGGEGGAPGRSLADDTDPLKKALAAPRLGLWGMLAALGLALLLGAAHALSPGHGKTLVAAYLVGSHGTARHAVALGLIVTATHVFSVVLLGLAALWASEHVLPERLAPWLALAAGVLVAGMGGWMLWRRGRTHHGGQDHGNVHGRERDHDHVGDHVQDQVHGHGHHGEHAGVRWGELVVLGISGGMVPCPSAMVVLLAAVYVGRVGLGLALIGAFSLGLAATLVVLGILVVQGRSLLARWSLGSRGARIVRLLPLLSAAAVTLLGVAMTVLALADL